MDVMSVRQILSTGMELVQPLIMRCRQNIMYMVQCKRTIQMSIMFILMTFVIIRYGYSSSQLKIAPGKIPDSLLSEMTSNISNNLSSKGKLNTSFPQNKTLINRKIEPEENKPATNIFYLKIHKCSSSTMQMMFARYAIQNNLTTVTLAPKPHNFPSPALFPYVFPHFRDVTEYNMLTSHIVFSENQIRQVLPRDTKFLTLLREPFSLLQSVFNYYHLCTQFRMSVCTLVEFLDDPKRYDKRATKSYVKGYSASYTKNFMARHLGFDDFSPPGFNISHWIEYIDERFDFIGLVEYLPESLVYIRRLLSWSTKDILFLPLRNTTLKNSNAKPVRQVPPNSTFNKLTSRKFQLGHVSLWSVNVTKRQDLRDKYRVWSPIDHLLYDYFSREFHQKVTSLGKDFKQEVQTFKLAQSTVSEFCFKWCPFLRKIVKGKRIPSKLSLLRNITVHIEENDWNPGFYVSLEDCLLMMVNPDSIRKIYMGRRQQKCNGPKCHVYLGHSLPPNHLTYLTCIGRWSL